MDPRARVVCFARQVWIPLSPYGSGYISNDSALPFLPNEIPSRSRFLDLPASRDISLLMHRGIGIEEGEILQMDRKGNILHY